MGMDKFPTESLFFLPFKKAHGNQNISKHCSQFRPDQNLKENNIFLSLFKPTLCGSPADL